MPNTTHAKIGYTRSGFPKPWKNRERDSFTPSSYSSLQFGKPSRNSPNNLQSSTKADKNCMRLLRSTQKLKNSLTSGSKYKSLHKRCVTPKSFFTTGTMKSSKTNKKCFGLNSKSQLAETEEPMKNTEASSHIISSQFVSGSYSTFPKNNHSMLFRQSKDWKLTESDIVCYEDIFNMEDDSEILKEKIQKYRDELSHSKRENQGNKERISGIEKSLESKIAILSEKMRCAKDMHTKHTKNPSTAENNRSHTNKLEQKVLKETFVERSDTPTDLFTSQDSEGVNTIRKNTTKRGKNSPGKAKSNNKSCLAA